jgi:hypothetical protein
MHQRATASPHTTDDLLVPALSMSAAPFDALVAGSMQAVNQREMDDVQALPRGQLEDPTQSHLGNVPSSFARQPRSRRDRRLTTVPFSANRFGNTPSDCGRSTHGPHGLRPNPAMKATNPGVDNGGQA